MTYRAFECNVDTLMYNVCLWQSIDIQSMKVAADTISCIWIFFFSDIVLLLEEILVIAYA